MNRNCLKINMDLKSHACGLFQEFQESFALPQLDQLSAAGSAWAGCGSPGEPRSKGWGWGVCGWLVMGIDCLGWGFGLALVGKISSRLRGETSI